MADVRAGAQTRTTWPGTSWVGRLRTYAKKGGGKEGILKEHRSQLKGAANC